MNISGPSTSSVKDAFKGKAKEVPLEDVELTPRAKSINLNYDLDNPFD